MNLLYRPIQMKSLAVFAPTVLVIVLIVASALPSQAQIPIPTIIYGFQQAPTDTVAPFGAIAQGRDGNIYGTGTGRALNGNGGVYKITPSGTEVLLVSFPANWPNCQGLTLAMDGNFYGTCNGGGPGPNTLGLIYRLTPAGVLTDIHDFTDTVGDAMPNGAPVLGADGNLYGTTGNGNGVAGNVYRITTAGVYKSLYTFSGGNSVPSVLNIGSDGNLYGSLGDAAGFGNVGGVFRISTGGAFKLLYGFVSATRVYYPNNPMIRATNGKLYGTTFFTSGTGGNGTIYDLTIAGVVTDLYNWASGTNLDGGVNSMLQATNGNFYGASPGGASGNMGGLFELTSTGVYSSFLFTQQSVTGSQPSTPLMQHTNGTVFGTNSTGGAFPDDGLFFSLNIGASPFISLVTPVSAGKEGTQVGILGQGFSSSSVVKFGGTTVTTQTLTGTTFIEATVPAGALTAKVTVTTGSTTLSTTAIYKVTPTFKTFTPPSGPVATVVTITGTGLEQTTKVTFNKVVATFTVVSDTEITATVSAGATTGKIAITTKGGSASNATSFTVN